MMTLGLRWDMIKPKNNSLLLLREGEHEEFLGKRFIRLIIHDTKH